MEKYLVLQTIGKGLHKVKLVYDPINKKKYAAKICKTSFKKSGLIREASYLEKLGKLSIPHTLQFIEILDKEEVKKSSQFLLQDKWKVPQDYDYSVAIILELAPNGTLFDLILDKGPLEEKIARSIFRKLVLAVADLHDNGYVHKDLKPENILLDEDFQLKIGDFGLCEQFDLLRGDKMTSKVGTENYIPPEFYDCQSYSGTKVDVFGLGVILFLLVIGSPPFFKATQNDPFYKYFVQGKTDSFWQAFEKKLRRQQGFKDSFKHLIEELLSNNADLRPTTKNVLGFNWMKEDIYSDHELRAELEKLITSKERE